MLLCFSLWNKIKTWSIFQNTNFQNLLGHTARRSENGFWSGISWSHRFLSILHSIFLPLCVILTEFHSCSEESASEEGSFLCSNPAAVCFICTVLRHKKKPILSKGLASEWGNGYTGYKSKNSGVAAVKQACFHFVL